MKDRISLLISSCDKYQYLWENLIKLEEKYLPFKKEGCDRFGVSESVPFEHGYISVCTDNAEWTDRLLAAVREVKTPYVLLSLDDFYPKQEMTSLQLDLNLQLMEKQNADKLFWVYQHPPHKDVWGKYYTPEWTDNDEVFGFYGVAKPNVSYKNSVQPGIWRTDYLKDVLEFNKGKNPWDFEVKNQVPYAPKIIFWAGKDTADYDDYYWHQVVAQGKLYDVFPNNRENYMKIKEENNLETLPVE